MAPAWTARDIPPQAGRIAVVTGANRGIGLATARELARAGATVVVAGRRGDRAQAAADGLVAELPGATIEAAELDLADLSSIERFAQGHRRRFGALDVLVNNAAVMYTPRARTVDGFELQLGTNHLGPFALTGRLLGAMTGTDARVVTVTSIEHRRGHLHLDDLMLTRRYGRYRAYRQSKLANASFSLELDRRLRAAGRAVTSVAVHPGYTATAPAPGVSVRPDRLAAAALKRLAGQPVGRGALPLLYAATAPAVAGGTCIGPDGRGELRGGPTVVPLSSDARDPAIAHRLWVRSEELTGVTIDPANLP